MVQGSTPLLVLFGSNLGTAEEIAHQIADDGRTHGFTTTVAPLDDYVEKLPKDGGRGDRLVLLQRHPRRTTQPAFSTGCATIPLVPMPSKGVSYTVFGCGDRDWAATYQRVPKMIDTEMEAHGARRVYQRGEGDASDDFDGQFRGWYEHLWNALAGALGTSVEAPDAIVKGHRYEVELVTEPVEASPRRRVRRQADGDPGEPGAAEQNRATPLGALDPPHRARGARRRDLRGGRPPRDPPAQQRRAGTPRHGALRAPRRRLIRIRNNTASKTRLPVDKPVSASALLSGYVDLQGVARRSEIQVLAEYTECPPEKEKLLAIGGDDPDGVARYREEVLSKNVSLIDLLEEFTVLRAAVQRLPRATAAAQAPLLLDLLLPPMIDSARLSITVGVVEGPARSGRGEYQGSAPPTSRSRPSAAR